MMQLVEMVCLLLVKLFTDIMYISLSSQAHMHTHSNYMILCFGRGFHLSVWGGNFVWPLVTAGHEVCQLSRAEYMLQSVEDEQFVGSTEVVPFLECLLSEVPLYSIHNTPQIPPLFTYISVCM